MNWNNIDNQIRIIYGDQFANIPKPFERKFIIGAIADEFPQFSRIRIAVAVDQCFKINAMPISRSTLLTFIQSSLW